MQQETNKPTMQFYVMKEIPKHQLVLAAGSQDLKYFCFGFCCFAVIIFVAMFT